MKSSMLNRLRWRSPRVTIPAAAALVAALILGWHWLPGSARSVAAPATPKGIPVETAAAGRADVPVRLEGLGTVQAYYTVTITARVDGQLQKVAFTEGQTVRHDRDEGQGCRPARERQQ
jgi:multidrug efflux system membrane fusion protein